MGIVRDAAAEANFAEATLILKESRQYLEEAFDLTHDLGTITAMLRLSDAIGIEFDMAKMAPFFAVVLYRKEQHEQDSNTHR